MKRLKKYLLIAAGFVILVGSLPRATEAFTLPPVEVFAKIDGLSCQGLSTDAMHPGEIIVRSLSETISETTGTKAQPTPLIIVKDFDGCSPLLYRALVLGKRLPRVQISFTFVDGAGRIEFFRIELMNVTIMGMTIGQSDQTSEQISISFVSLRLTDIAINPDGRPGASTTVTCNFIRNSCN